MARTIARVLTNAVKANLDTAKALRTLGYPEYARIAEQIAERCEVVLLVNQQTSGKDWTGGPFDT